MLKRAMILAAGEGRRMRPLTLDTPKPLLQVGGQSLIEWHLRKLSQLGIEDVVINLAYLAEQIIEHLGDGSKYGLKIAYSQERKPLETGGALNHALPLLEGAPFLLLNGDVWTDYPLQQLVKMEPLLSGAHMVMIPNPRHHPMGDFTLHNQLIRPQGEVGEPCTFSGLSVFDPACIARYPDRREKFPLREVFDWLIKSDQLSGELYKGEWMDIGTPERLSQLNKMLQGR
ncbi:Nucleoside-diphosphate-sugar pyrophosphorylase involved in lipopolysaccharide biosynthesis/translation initiation factor 2B, gamma/epsilon subunits (eIF-2Bgamma/eIF-2Bepsilon) [Alteromonadaceae bacterium Bs31]|nr:Nucleoside-diphosphate-sugar pyrophosphorylase involved in lipopolysaccharide biosynthesis/translation initiation factor 2B, gamma/epsilon subunits (eIF-2Bgamma/eIF-2Bepsilon) [Alteromonadaceae bacterium Bs31]